MRATGVMHPTDGPYVPPDTVTTLLLTGGSSAQAQDWLSSGSTALANAGSTNKGAQIVRITGVSTGGTLFALFVNLMSTAATVPTSGTSIASSGVSHPVVEPTFFQIPGASTGWSVAAFTSGYAIVEQWMK